MGGGTAQGFDIKCYGLPHMDALGVAQPTVVDAASLGVGETLLINASVVWSSPTAGVRRSGTRVPCRCWPVGIQ